MSKFEQEFLAEVPAAGMQDSVNSGADRSSAGPVDAVDEASPVGLTDPTDPTDTADAQAAPKCGDAGTPAPHTLTNPESEQISEDSDEDPTAQLADDLARAQADLYNLRQEYQNYVRRSKADAPTHRQAGQAEVMESLISVLDDIEAARSHGDLGDGPFAAIAQKLEQTLDSRFGMSRYGEAGEAFDPAIHDALMAQPSSEVEVDTVGQVLQPGYRLGERVLRPAKVMVLGSQ